MTISGKIRIFIVEDHEIVRQGLVALLEKEPDFQVIGEAADGRIALKMVKDLAPHVVIMDVSMPELNGIETTLQIKKEMPKVKVVALSMHDNRRFVLEMLKAGASGYLLKDCALKELSEAIRAAAIKNKVYLSHGITGLAREENLSVDQNQSSIFSMLSPREREVLQLVAEGNTSAQIAAKLGVSAKTVESHRSMLMSKLKVNSVADLTRIAIREGIISG